MDPSLIKTNVNRLIDSRVLPQQVADAIGAAVKESAAGKPEFARDLYEAFARIACRTAGDGALAPNGFVGRPNLMKRLAELSNTYSQSAVNLPAPNPETMARLIQDAIGGLQAPVQNKLGAMDTAMPMKRKRKKKGLGGKLKKGLKKIKSKMSKTVKDAAKAGKGLFSKVGKGLFKGVVGNVKGLFRGKMLNGLGGLFKKGNGVLGGLIGGPIGSRMLKQISGKKGAGLSQIFGQVNHMMQIVHKIRKSAGNLLTNGLVQRIRV